MSETHAADHAEKLKAYYAQFGIDVNDLLKEKLVPSDRHIRLNPAFDGDDTLKLLKTKLPQDSKYPHPISWLHKSFGFYSLPGDFRLSQSPCYKEGRIYGQEVSSGAAVAALLSTYCDRIKDNKTPQVPLRILDLCCAPGLKLCAISDYLRKNVLLDISEEATVIGVDCSEARLSTCRKIIEKHQVVPYIGSNEGKNVRIRLYHNDGTTFGSGATHLIFDSSVSMEQCVHDEGRKRRNKSAKGRERKRLKELADVDRHTHQDGKRSLSHIPIQLFDRVLVDVECSTDGSLKHVRRQLAKQAGVFVGTTIPETSESLSIPVLTDEEELRRLVDLQRSLLSNGFRLLKKGGHLVYSTCSLSEDQNEGVVKWLLDTYPSQASVIELSFDCAGVNECEKQGWDEIVKEGSIPGTVRFVPKLSRSNNMESLQMLSDSGFFWQRSLSCRYCETE